jgi:hypothetical protein
METPTDYDYTSERQPSRICPSHYTRHMIVIAQERGNITHDRRATRNKIRYLQRYSDSRKHEPVTITELHVQQDSVSNIERRTSENGLRTIRMENERLGKGSFSVSPKTKISKRDMPFGARMKGASPHERRTNNTSLKRGEKNHFLRSISLLTFQRIITIISLLVSQSEILRLLLPVSVLLSLLEGATVLVFISLLEVSC